jgi:hypothetical protein
MSAGIKANNDGSAAIQVGGTDYITISSTGAVAIPVSLTVGGVPAGGNYAMDVYVAPATWVKPLGLKAIKVTVLGGGGNGGTSTYTAAPNSAAASGGGGGGAAICYLDAPVIPGSPITVTAGPGTNSFGSLVSATGGGNAANKTPAPSPTVGGSGGVGTVPSPAPIGSLTLTGQAGQVPGVIFPASAGGLGGASQLINALMMVSPTGTTLDNPIAPGSPNTFYGGGGQGGGTRNVPGTSTGGTGASGFVIVEEFY